MGGKLQEMLEPQKASEWLICLLEKPDDENLKAAFSHWFEKSTEHQRAWEKALNAYKLMGSVPPLHEEEWRQEKEDLHSTDRIFVASNDNGRLKRKKFWAASISVAASLLIVCLVGWQSHYSADYITGIGEVKEVALSDGSLVRLAPESRLNVSFTTTQRAVELVDGQAFFNVAHDTKSPFIVRAENSVVKVIGTAFDVSTRHPSVEVQVQEGIVSVKPDETEEIILRVGDTIRVKPDYSLIHGKIEPKYVSSWKENRLIVNDRPVSEVVETLSHYHSATLLVLGDDIGEQPVTGVYQLTNPDAALSAIAQSVGAKIYHVTPWITVISSI
ncbi:FecR family protein [Curvivirga aplysinae]|uniref:FecR family protein n=1 Tax=Curvivirga aplysinae TaxID=2529852 RepID=UPI001C3F7AA2|nr:FecR family protein [Curvivirga aplysinae]